MYRHSIRESDRDERNIGTYSRSTCHCCHGRVDHASLDGRAGAGGDKHSLGTMTKIHDTRYNNPARRFRDGYAGDTDHGYAGDTDHA
jgi:hypothetical protein